MSFADLQRSQEQVANANADPVTPTKRILDAPHYNNSLPVAGSHTPHVQVIAQSQVDNVAQQAGWQQQQQQQPIGKITGPHPQMQQPLNGLQYPAPFGAPGYGNFHHPNMASGFQHQPNPYNSQQVQQRMSFQGQQGMRQHGYDYYAHGVAGGLPIDPSLAEKQIEMQPSKRMKQLAPPGFARHGSDISDTSTIADDEVPLLVYESSSREYQLMMKYTREHFARWFSVSTDKDGEDSDADDEDIEEKESKQETIIATRAFGSAILHEKNKAIRKMACEQVRKWCRHWQCDMLKLLRNNLSSVIGVPDVGITVEEAWLDQDCFLDLFEERCNIAVLKTVFNALNKCVLWNKVWQSPEARQFYTDMYSNLSWVVFTDTYLDQRPPNVELPPGTKYAKFRSVAKSDIFSDFTQSMIPFGDSPPSRNAVSKKKDPKKQIQSFMSSIKSGNRRKAANAGSSAMSASPTPLPLAQPVSPVQSSATTANHTPEPVSSSGENVASEVSSGTELQETPTGESTSGGNISPGVTTGNE